MSSQAQSTPASADVTVTSPVPALTPVPELLRSAQPEVQQIAGKESPAVFDAGDPSGEMAASLPEEPWRIKVLARDPYRTQTALPQQRKTLPWRMGDVSRLKNDSPEGMMRYIAMHCDGLWGQMAERAIRDVARIEQMAEEAGVQPGQCWTLQVDEEARARMRGQEEERRIRAQAEREAFLQRQMELLEKAGRAPRCEYLYSDGSGCKAPQNKGERWCHSHARMMSYRPDRLELVPMEDENAVELNLWRVQNALLRGAITERMAALMLYSIAIGAPGVKRVKKPGRRRGPGDLVIGRSGDRKGKNRVRRRSAQKGADQEKALAAKETHSARFSRSGQGSQCEGKASQPQMNANPGVAQDKSLFSGVDGGPGASGHRKSKTLARHRPAQKDADQERVLSRKDTKADDGRDRPRRNLRRDDVRNSRSRRK